VSEAFATFVIHLITHSHLLSVLFFTSFRMLFPCLVFQYTFLCPTICQGSLPHPPSIIPWYAALYALGFSAFTTVSSSQQQKRSDVFVIDVACVLFFPLQLVAFKSNGRHLVLVYVFVFIVMFVSLTAWRLWIWS
jgi:hypothetical protein